MRIRTRFVEGVSDADCGVFAGQGMVRVFGVGDASYKVDGRDSGSGPSVTTVKSLGGLRFR